LAQVLDLLRREGRVSYRALKRRFELDDDYLEDLKEELIYAKKLAVDEEGRVLFWTGKAEATPAPAGTASQPAPPSTDEEDHPFPVAAPATEQVVPDAERRQLTVMFCDLADSTQLSGRLDPEDLREVIRAYQQASAEVIEQFDGHVAQYLGDGLLVYFGFPRAHEDDAERAVRAGLGILDAIGALHAHLERDKGVQLAVRVAVHTGLVVVGGMGGGDRRANLALGETPNIAARLEGLAQPNTVVISGATARLAGGAFVLEDLGAHHPKGVAEPVSVVRVLGPVDELAEEEDFGPERRTPLVGRDEEVGLLQRRWDQSKDGLGQVVLISGEAGIGKSALVETVRAQVVGEGVTRNRFPLSALSQPQRFLSGDRARGAGVRNATRRCPRDEAGEAGRGRASPGRGHDRAPGRR
jgi:class 3 adenylate cyclase